MNQEELKTLVAQMLRELAPQPEPQVKGSEYRPTVLEPQPARQPEDPGQLLPDISEIDLREQYLVGRVPGIKQLRCSASGRTMLPLRTVCFPKLGRNLPRKTA